MAGLRVRAGRAGRLRVFRCARRRRISRLISSVLIHTVARPRIRATKVCLSPGLTRTSRAPASSRGKSTSLPGVMPNRSRTCWGIVTRPLLVTRTTAGQQRVIPIGITASMLHGGDHDPPSDTRPSQTALGRRMRHSGDAVVAVGAAWRARSRDHPVMAHNPDSWWLDEREHAGREHFDERHARRYDSKMDARTSTAAH
ncbi:MAG: hypothetical protein QOF69_2978 [Solirubrobacteraceae bacterium]|nr:hypothetical protein [Solirubrobacteraceae bacterium]